MSQDRGAGVVLVFTVITGRGFFLVQNPAHQSGVWSWDGLGEPFL